MPPGCAKWDLFSVRWRQAPANCRSGTAILSNLSDAAPRGDAGTDDLMADSFADVLKSQEASHHCSMGRRLRDLEVIAMQRVPSTGGKDEGVGRSGLACLPLPELRKTRKEETIQDGARGCRIETSTWGPVNRLDLPLNSLDHSW